ncbi:acyl-CoA dehydrogenase [Mycolicibacterium komossense]|uniref:Acyl-CoA dehydrogenase n=1 Tax=Mycolicibacterium komossense TaxID=1779 RepID=A0ABT3CGQ0_9MYCO|nr:acyl-CoA dehydrogenase [Mycolicibacterium komossense]MCV7228406.1 acyl-CoA dehydrogenase [Mycolicibacterium komossense]
MPLAITEEQQQLADAVGSFAARQAPVAQTRALFDATAAGDLPPWWGGFVDNGFHAVHLPEDIGGQGGTLMDMACVIEAAATALLPGPWLTTAIAGAVALSGGSAAPESLLKDLAAGTTAVVVLPDHSDVRATAAGDSWRLSGSTGITLGICSAQRILLPATTDDGHRWFVVDTESTNLRAEPRNGTDLCTDVGVLALTDVTLPLTSVLPGIDTERVRALAAALTACAAAGTVRWCLTAATDHLRTREQFGKPIGTFQALQHKSATLLVNTELAEAAAWDAVRAADESVEQHRIAASAAALVAVIPAPDLVLDALLMFGAIGYTWEHDIQLYWRRATSLGGSLGPAPRWSREAGEFARTVQRSQALNLGDVESEFRSEIADILDRAVSLSNDGSSRQDDRPEFDIGPRRDLLAESGLVAPQLPAPWGMGANALQQVIIAEEYEKRPAMLRPTLGIAEWMAPTIIDAGTDEQRDRFVWPTLRGVLQWCQLYSEPGAGSDLASLTTRAAKVDGGWVVNGRKIWTSMADGADFGALLARTDPDAPKHRGLSYFLVDMETEGLDVTPIRQANGAAKFCEVVLTDVFVPDAMLVGQPGDGWGLAVGAMAVERTAIGNYVSIDRTEALRHLAAIDGPDRDAVVRSLGEIQSYTSALKALVTRETLRLVEGGKPGAASSIAKVAMSTLLRRASTAMLAHTGRSALVEDSDPEVFVPYFHQPSELIGGGTAEIQLTVIAQMILGLPRT